MSTRLLGILALLAMLLPGSAAAVDFVVSVGSGCRYASLQAGIDALHGDVDVIHIRQGYVSGPISIQGKTVTIVGGFADCNEDVNAQGDPAHRSVIDGANQASAISIGGRAYVVLQHLTVQEGFNQASGGGISYTSSGCSDAAPCNLELQDVQVTNNVANTGAGGGIYVHGGSAPTILRLHDNTFIDHNFAGAAGGGIHISGQARLLMLEAQTILVENTANIENSNDGRGGAIQVLGPARVDIGSPGYSGFPVILSNHARAGAGISIHNGAQVRMFPTAPSAAPVRIEGNDALLVGGGIYIEVSGGTLCASGYRINGNSAQDGSAIYANDNNDTDFNTIDLSHDNTFGGCGPEPGVALGAVDCLSPTLGHPCNMIDGNIITRSGSAIVALDTELKMENIEINGNLTDSFGQASLLDVNDVNHHESASLSNCLIARNDAGNLITTTDNRMNLSINGCTIADNTVGASAIYIQGGTLNVANSILWSTGGRTLTQAGGVLPVTVSFKDVIASETDSLDPDLWNISHILNADPQFVDPGSGNYHLRPSSQAIDFSDASQTVVDLDSNARGLHPGSCRRGSSLFDAGAYELQLDVDCIFGNGYD